MKKFVALCLSIVLLCGTVAFASCDESIIAMRLPAIVTYVNPIGYAIEATDFNGQTWVFYGEDFSEGDFVLLTLDTMRTPAPFDDEVIDCRFIVHIDNWEDLQPPCSEYFLFEM